MNTTSETPSRPSGYPSLLLVSAVTLALSLRLYWVIAKFSVNLFYADEWDYYAPLFSKMPLWRAFFLQHGPAREGLGVVLVNLLLQHSRWNSRVQAYTVGAVIVFAAVAALYLRRRVFGPLVFSDAVIPIMFLGLGQWEVFISSPGASAQAVPLLLAIVYCLAWCQEQEFSRYALVAVFNLLLLFTGYGFFMAAVTLFLLALDIVQRTKNNRSVAPPMATVVTALVLLAIFFYHYVFNPAVACYHFPEATLTSYPLFMAVGFARFLGIKHGLMIAAIVGTALLLLAFSLVLFQAQSLLSQPSLPRAQVVVIILLGYSLLFAASAAVGRVCLGLEAARASRNMTLLTPTFLGIYFYLLEMPSIIRRKIATAIFLLMMLPSCVQRYHKEIEGFSASKLAWKECYSRLEDIKFCDQATGFQAYPWPESIDLKTKLDYLKKHELNLYASVD